MVGCLGYIVSKSLDGLVQEVYHMLGLMCGLSVLVVSAELVNSLGHLGSFIHDYIYIYILK